MGEERSRESESGKGLGGEEGGRHWDVKVIITTKITKKISGF